MKYFSTLLISLSLSASVQAEELIESVSLAEDPLTIAAVAGQQLHPLIEIGDPRITSPVYALKGLVRYEDVEGDGYLQLDSHFGATGTFFSKTLAPTGPLAKLSGSSDWRGFTLPFYATTGDQADAKLLLPEKLSLALYLPGSGTVSIRNVGVYQYSGGEDPVQFSGQWYGDRIAGLLGGIGGGLLGVWGALIGILAGRGKARGFVLGSAKVLLVIGLVSAASGVWALISGQPYAIYFSLLLIGVIILAVIGSLRGSLAARYEQFELQKMRSMDV